MPLWIFYLFFSSFGLPIFAIWGLWFLYRAIVAAGRAERARRVGDAVSDAGREFEGIAKREAARGAVRTQLDQDLDFLEREHRTGGITDGQYAERVAYAKRRAEIRLDQTEGVDK